MVGYEIRDGVGHIVRLSPALERNAVGDATNRLGRVPELLCGTRCFDRPGCNGIDTDVVASPFDGERLRHGHHARLGGRGMYRAGAAGPDIVCEDGNDRTATAARNHVASHGPRTIEAAVQHDPDYGVPSVR